VVTLKKHLFIAVIFCLCYFISQAQKSKIDSLQHVLKTAKEDTTKINTLNQIAMRFRNSNPDTAICFARQALEFSERIKFKKGIAEAYLWMGTAYSNMGKYSEALNLLSKALKGTNDKKISAQIYNNIGNAYFSQDKYSEALKSHFASLKIKRRNWR
jgi:tetratricopeptide (TPR) repeat protein